MKIYYLADSVIPSRSANSVHVMRMCHAMAVLGHDVTLLIPRTPDPRIGGPEPDVDDVFAFYGVQPNFRIDRQPNRRLHRHVTSLAMGLRARFSGADRVYGRQILSSMVAAALGKDTTLELHEPVDATPARARMMRALPRLPGLRGVVVISENLRRRVEETHPGLAGRVLVAHDGADPMADADPVALDPPGSFHVGYVGQLYAGKGMELIARIAPLCPWARFHIVGGRPDDLLEWTRRTAEQSNIVYHGFQPQPRLPAYLAAFDAVVAPYQARVLGSYGGVDIAKWMSPLKLFEYMSASKAIVCSNLPVLREVLTHERTALLIDPDDPRAWADELDRLRRDEGLRMRLGAAAFAQFERNHTWLKRAERLTEALADGGFAPTAPAPSPAG